MSAALVLAYHQRPRSTFDAFFAATSLGFVTSPAKLVAAARRTNRAWKRRFGKRRR